ncbi:MAG: hypothetical protein C0605_03025 [Hyphomicrobiales bacterium]|nr:MAG: hypothetical protein C0605_03025 [Hyphomicrobiales bacterium]
MTLDRDAARLWRSPLFSEIDPAQLKMLAFAAARVRRRPGEVLIREGEKTNAAFVIMSGAVKYQPAESPEGTWKMLTEGAMIGEFALLTGKPNPVTFIAAEHLQALKISRNLISRFASEFPEIGESMLRAWKRRMSRSSSDLRALKAHLMQNPAG